MSTYCRRLPLHKVTTNKKIKDTIEELVIATNNLVREAYQFLRLYFLHLLEQEIELPLIDRSFLKGVFSLFSTKKSDSKLEPITAQLLPFYKEHYESINVTQVKVQYNAIIDYEITTMITCIENHIKNEFFTYINRLVFSICPNSKDKEENKYNKLQRKKIRDDLYNGTFNSDSLYHSLIKEFYPLIKENLEIRKSNPQLCLPFLYKVSTIIKDHNKKQLSILPLRRSFIPSYITIDSHIFHKYKCFKDILLEEQVDLWANIKDTIEKELSHKEGYKFTSLKTNGIGCSIVFRKEGKRAGMRDKKNLFKEKYFEDLKQYDEFKDRKIVGIDPNKGNLMYCYDGETVLRYTQLQRKKATKKTKYKNIRMYEEDGLLIRLKTDDDFHTIREDNKAMRDFNSRTCSFEDFKVYLKEKNLMAQRYASFYTENIFRKLNWNTKINTQRSEDLFVERFKHTYGENAVVVFGDWEERPNVLRGKEPSKGKSCRVMLRKAGFEVYLLDEFRTSITCHSCYGQNESNFQTRRHSKPWKRNEVEKVWALLRCKNGHCRKVHNRDFNSAFNILFIATYVITNGERPVPFKRNNRTCATTVDVGRFYSDTVVHSNLTQTNV